MDSTCNFFWGGKRGVVSVLGLVVCEFSLSQSLTEIFAVVLLELFGLLFKVVCHDSVR